MDKPMLLIFGDGFTVTSCALAYLRWQMANGLVQCQLLAGKTRVAPKCKILIPMMELMGAILAVRLAHKIMTHYRWSWWPCCTSPTRQQCWG